MTRAEERQIIVSSIESTTTKDLNGHVIYDPLFETEASMEQSIRIIDLVYEEIGDKYDTITDARLDRPFILSVMKNVLQRMVDESIITEEMRMYRVRLLDIVFKVA